MRIVLLLTVLLASFGCRSTGPAQVSDSRQLQLGGITIGTPCSRLAERLGSGFDENAVEGWYGCFELGDGRTLALDCAEVEGAGPGPLDAVTFAAGSRCESPAKSSARFPAAVLGGLKLGDPVARIEDRLGPPERRESGEEYLYPWVGKAAGVEQWIWEATRPGVECPHFASVFVRDGRIVGLAYSRSDC